jgi:hypothetical protein
MFGDGAPGALLKAIAGAIDFTEAEIKHYIYLFGAACYTQIYGKAVTKQIVREINVTEALPRFFAKAAAVQAHVHLPHHPIKVPAELQRSITATIYNSVHPFQIIKSLIAKPSWSLPTILMLLKGTRGKLAKIALRQLWKLASHSASGMWSSSESEHDHDDSDDDMF